jgi:hypothetical protein
MGIFGFLKSNKVNPRLCQECSGMGIVTHIVKREAPPGKILTGPDTVKEKVCPVCKGVGVVDVPGFENLNMKQIEALVKNRSAEDIIAEFKGMTPAAVEKMLRYL